jgi:uncharacterized surface protein with fasciclin (FAS1) repeats
MTFKTPLALAAAALMASGAFMTAHAGSPSGQAAMAQPASGDIVDVASGNGDFDTLVAAVKAAGLVDTLKGDGPFTVFAPTDAAFAALPPGTLDNLLKPENRDQLTRILTFHVVPGRVTSDQLAGKQTQAGTAAGQALNIDASGSGVMVQQATVTAADIPASNGVIHVIDSVLLPQD